MTERAEDTGDKVSTTKPVTDKDYLELAKTQALRSSEHYSHDIAKSLEERIFTYAEDQWDDKVRTARGDRPCLNANDLPVFLDQVVAEQRLNRGAITASPVDSDSDPKKAEIVGGLIRQIEYQSDAYVAYDESLEFAASGGYAGAIRVITAYEREDLFNDDGTLRSIFQDDPESAYNQECQIIPVPNPLNVLYDYSARLWHTNDGMFLFYFDDVNVDLFKETYPGKATVDFSAGVETEKFAWSNHTENTMRVAEWFFKESLGPKTVYMVLNPGEDDPAKKYTLQETPPEDRKLIIKEREVKDFRIMWRKMTGLEIIEGPIEIPGRLWPIIPVWGKRVNIDGAIIHRGMFRYAKDSQRGYIYTKSANTEQIALQPKNPYLGTAIMFGDNEEQWKTMNTENRSYMAFTPDPDFPGQFPKRESAPQLSTALIEEKASAQEEKRNVIGMQKANLGKESRAVSGRAIAEEKQSGQSVAFTYHDSLNRAIGQVGRVIDGMRSIIYGTPRTLEILGIDGRSFTQDVNQETVDKDGKKIPAIDLTVGKHDIVYKAGPAYATQRLEAAEKITNIMQYAPNKADLLVDIAVDMLGIPGGDKLVKRLEAALPPEIRAAGAEDGELSEGQVMQMIQQAMAEAVEEYKQSQEGLLAEEKSKQALEKTKQEELQTQQEVFQTEQARLKVEGEVENIKNKVADLVRDGEV